MTAACVWTLSALCPAWPSSSASSVSALPGAGRAEGNGLLGRRTREVGPHLTPLSTGHCSQHLDGGEGVVCLTHRQVGLECRARGAGGGVPGAPGLTLLSPLASGCRWPPSPRPWLGSPASPRSQPGPRGGGSCSDSGPWFPARPWEPACPELISGDTGQVPAPLCLVLGQGHAPVLCRLQVCPRHTLRTVAGPEWVPSGTPMLTHSRERGLGPAQAPTSLWEGVLHHHSPKKCRTGIEKQDTVGILLKNITCFIILSPEGRFIQKPRKNKIKNKLKKIRACGGGWVGKGEQNHPLTGS